MPNTVVTGYKLELVSKSVHMLYLAGQSSRKKRNARVFQCWSNLLPLAATSIFVSKFSATKPHSLEWDPGVHRLFAEAKAKHKSESKQKHTPDARLGYASCGEVNVTELDLKY